MRVSYSASAAFWALLASTAPHSLEAKQGLEVKAKGLRRKMIASSACTIMAIEFLAKEGEPHREMQLECELDPKDAGGISGITAPLSLSPHQRADLTEMIYSGEVDPGVDMLDIEGDEITESQEVKIDPVVKMSSKLSKTPSAEVQKQRRLVDTKSGKTHAPTNQPTPNPTPAPVPPTPPPTAFPTNPPTPNPTPAPVAPTFPPTASPTIPKSGKTQAPTNPPTPNPTPAPVPPTPPPTASPTNPKSGKTPAPTQAGATESIQLHRIRED